MSLLDRFKYYLWGKAWAVAGLIERWNPPQFQNEKDYENALYEFLHIELGEIQVTKQFASGRMRADLVVGNKVVVELKHNLNTTGKYHNLVGQLESYLDWKGPIVIVLMGKTEPNLRKELRAYIRKHLDIFPGQEKKFWIVEKLIYSRTA